MLNLTNYLVPLDQLDGSKLLLNWSWLLEHDKTLLSLTKMGDALLYDKPGRLFHLGTGAGEVNLICDNYWDFYNGVLKQDVYEEVLLPGLLDELESGSVLLELNQVYSFYVIPLIGGSYGEGNRYPLCAYEHYNLTGEVHFKLSNLPDGTQVSFKVE